MRKFTSFLWLCVAIDHRGPRAPRLLAVVRGPRCRIPREHPRSPPRDRSFASPRRTMDPSMLTPEMMAFAQKQMANMTPSRWCASPAEIRDRADDGNFARAASPAPRPAPNAPPVSRSFPSASSHLPPLPRSSSQAQMQKMAASMGGGMPPGAAERMKNMTAEDMKRASEEMRT